MNKAPHSKRWFSGWLSAGPVQHDDFADMGTAFGLDQSMEALAPAATVGQADDPTTHQTANRGTDVRRQNAGWVKRLTLRRRTVA